VESKLIFTLDFAALHILLGKRGLLLKQICGEKSKRTLPATDSGLGAAAMTTRSGIKRIINMSSEFLDRLKYRKYFPRPDGNTALDWHIAEAAAWLIRAQDCGEDRGVSYGAQLGNGFLPSYPETTGYIIPTFLELAQHYGDYQYLQRAIEMGKWEVSIQMSCGAVMAGRVNVADPQPAMFNTGQVLLGWSALVKAAHEEQFRQAGVRAADWMVANQEPDGNWIRGNSPFADANATLYNVKAAWGLADFGAATGTSDYVEAALRNAQYTVLHQRSNGWFEKCCLTDPDHPLLHTLAYTMQGLLGIGRLTGRTDLIGAVETTAESLLHLMDDHGFIPGRIDSGFRGSVDWCCLTGSAQTSVVWAELHEITGKPRYLDGVRNINRYLMLCHDTSSPDPTVRGGLTGSWPVWGDYGQYMVLNWATKFFVDALLLQKRLLSPATGRPQGWVPGAR